MLKSRIIYSILVMILTMILGIPQTAYAQPPSMPQGFWGSVTIDGNQAPPGTTVSVLVGGTEVASATTDAQGMYACTVSGTNGATVGFYVNGVQSQQSYTLSSGAITKLNLSTGAVSPPSSPPPAPPAPTPPEQAPSAPIPPATARATNTPVLGQSDSPAAPAPASFTVSGLKISPTSMKPSQQVTITVTIANSGGTEGSYNAVLEINGVDEAQQQVTLGPKGKQEITFTTSKETIGNYSVAIEGESSSFKVSAPGQATRSNWSWPLIGGIAAGVLLIIFIIIVLLRRRAYYY
jgi:hypothetical protein